MVLLNGKGWADSFRLNNGQDFCPLKKNDNQKLSSQQESFFVS